MSVVSTVTGILVFLVASLSADRVHATLSGFPDLSDLQRDAARLYDSTVRYEQTTLFPTITFNCAGRVTSLTFMASVRDTGSADPQWVVWERDDDGGRYRRVSSEMRITVDQLTEVSSFIFTLSPDNMTFSEGNFLGLYQPDFEHTGIDMFLQEGGGPENVYADGLISDILFSESSSDRNDYPLVSVQTDPPGCAVGFLSTEALMRYVEVHLVTSYEREQRLFPLVPSIHDGIRFTCDATLNKWTVAGQIGEGPSHPELQVWEVDDLIPPHFDRVKSFSLVGSDLQPRSNQRNVYDCIPDEEVTISSDSVLGLFHPAFDESNFIVYYQLYLGPLNFGISDRDSPSDEFAFFNSPGFNYPMVTVDVTPADCAIGFISTETLVSLAGQAPFLATFADVYGQQRIIPAMNITQDGLLAKWTFAAKILSGASIGEIEYPELHILRLNSGDTYDIVHKTDSSEQPSRTGFLNVYEYLPNPPFIVGAGDILGFRQPPESSSRLSLAVIEGAGPPNEIMEPSSRKRQTNTANDLPLILVDIEMLPPSTSVPVVMTTKPVTSKTTIVRVFPSPTPASSPMTSTVPMTSETSSAETMSPSPSPVSTSMTSTESVTDSTSSPSPPTGPEEKGEPSSPVAAIAGAIVGVLVAIGVIAAVATIIVCVLKKRKTGNKRLSKKRSNRFPEHPMDNPVYGGNISGVHYAAGSQTLEHLLPREYEIPSTTNTTARVNDTNTYATPDATSGNGKMNGMDNPKYMHPEAHYYSSANKPSLSPSQNQSTSNPVNHYEWGIYVPTKQQRKGIASSVLKESIYASLRETQQCGSGDRTFFTESETYWTPAKDEDELYQQLASNKYREIPRPQIQTQSHLGSGQFGTVYKGVWHSPRGGIEVAVKMLQNSSREDQVKFLQEAAINGQFSHPNVVKLHGVVTMGEPVMIVLELLMNGDLRHFLIKQQPDPGELVSPDMPNTLLHFCREIASGMQYLSGKAFVHRDLAARNILVAKDKTCKISDFGMSRDLEDENYYVSHGGKIPVKWTAPEALHYKKYSTASDVWSFGVVMYEIWSLGRKPFEEYTNVQAMKMLDTGFRLPPPPGCPKEIYKLMISCWNPDKSRRPTFTQLLQELSQPETDLLIWSEEDYSVHQQAAVLGAPLEAGKELYPELQNSYKQP